MKENGQCSICSEVLIVLLIPNLVYYLSEIPEKAVCYIENLMLNVYRWESIMHMEL